MQNKLIDLEDENTFDELLGQANIAVRLENVLYDKRYEPVNNLFVIFDNILC